MHSKKENYNQATTPKLVAELGKSEYMGSSWCLLPSICEAVI